MNNPSQKGTNVSLAVVAFIFILVLIQLTFSATTAARQKSPVIPGQAIDALAQGNLDDALMAMRRGPANRKLLYLIREVTRIVHFHRRDKRPRRSEAHNIYQNVAIAYHNLYLFLKRRGIDQEEYGKLARRYYHKARRAGTIMHKAECEVLEAALEASAGNKKKAAKEFSRIDPEMLRWDFESMEYLAAYHAAMEDVPAAVSALKEAYRLNPKRTKAWLAVGDDFSQIQSDPLFTSLIQSWKTDKGRDIALSLPAREAPKLETIEHSGTLKAGRAPSFNRRWRRK
jgi:tetratricopeptide (TPR) repeat protein